MVGAERTAVFPLRVADAVSVLDCDPPALEHGLARALESLLEPGNDLAGLRFGRAAGDIIVRQRDVERVLPRGEFGRDVVPAGGWIGIVVAAVVAGPIDIPGAFVIRNRVIDRRTFSDPEDRGHDLPFPGIPVESGAEGGGSDNLGFDLDQGVLPEPLGVFLKIGTRRDGRLRLGGPQRCCHDQHCQYGGSEIHCRG